MPAANASAASTISGTTRAARRRRRLVRRRPGRGRSLAITPAAVTRLGKVEDRINRRLISLRMTGVDWLIVGFTLLLAFYGYLQGFIVGALSLIGFALGAF